MKKYFLLAAVCALIGLLFPWVRVLSVCNQKNFSERIYSTEWGRGFVISYTHSVNKGRVHDFYAPAASGGLELYRTEFVSYGAGIPESSETEGAVFCVTDKSYAIDGLARILPRLVMAVGVEAEHSVRAASSAASGDSASGGGEFFLKDFFAEQTSLVFELKRVSPLDYILHSK